jgi:hypothetical protein
MNKSLPSKEIPTDFPTDDSWKTMDRKSLADILMKNGYAGLVPLKNSFAIQKGYNKYKPPTKDPLKTDYVDLIERVEAQYTEIRKDSKMNQHVTEERKARLQVLGERITTMRKQENSVFMVKFLQGSPGIKVGVLPDVIVEKVASDIPGHPDYERVNLQQSMDDVYGKGKPKNSELKKWTGEKKTGNAGNYLFSYVSPQSSLYYT